MPQHRLKSPLPDEYCTTYIVHCTMYIGHFTFVHCTCTSYNVHLTFVHCAFVHLYIVHLYIVHIWLMNTVHVCTSLNILYEKCCAIFFAYSVFYTIIVWYLLFGTYVLSYNYCNCIVVCIVYGVNVLCINMFPSDNVENTALNPNQCSKLLCIAFWHHPHIQPVL